MKAVVMAGGEGSRLRPLTVARPKPLMPVGNRPILAWILDHLAAHGVTEAVVTLHHLGDEIEAVFGDGEDHGVRLEYVRERVPLGTAGAVAAARHLLPPDEPFLLVSGDALTDADLGAAIAAHRERRAVATLVLARVPNPLEFGVVVTAPDGRVERFLEKPSWSEVFSDTVNTGMYVLEPEVLDLVEPGRPVDWSADVFPRLLAQKRPIYGWIMDGHWADVGTLAEYRRANADALEGRVGGVTPVHRPYRVDESAEIVPPVAFGAGVRVKRGARIGPHVCLGDHTIVEEGAVVARSVVMDSCYVGAEAHLDGAILGERAAVKANVSVGEGAVVADRTLVDANSVIRPRVKIWPDKIVERGSVVTMSLVHGDRWRGGLFQGLGVSGISNLEITPEVAVRLAAAFGSTLPQGSRVVTARDSTRSSRMVKRALISALLSSGCDVLDLRSAPPPVARHFLKQSGAAGAMNVRKLPGNRRVSLIELYDRDGAYLPKERERKVETLYFREDFRRPDPDDLGQLAFAARATEEYQEAFFSALGVCPRGRRLRAVCDFGYSALGPIFPAMLAQLGVDVLSLNAYSEARSAPRSAAELARHRDGLAEIVRSLGYDLGVLFYQEGERMVVLDGGGRTVAGHALSAVLARVAPGPRDRVLLPITAPARLERWLGERGVETVRAKADVRSLMAAGGAQGPDFGADGEGGFLFPAFHPGFDAMFAFARLAFGLRETGASLSALADELPDFSVGYEVVRVPWERKGELMRGLADTARDARQVDLLDGIKIWDGDAWVLVLPDATEPLFHVFAEGENASDSERLARRHSERLRLGLGSSDQTGPAEWSPTTRGGLE